MTEVTEALLELGLRLDANGWIQFANLVCMSSSGALNPNHPLSSFVQSLKTEQIRNCERP